MKSRLIILCFITLSRLIVNAQAFEGEIIYVNRLTSKMQNFTDAQLETMIGTRQEYFIKGGNYKSLSNGQSLTMQLYNHETNRLYNKTSRSDTLYWFDASLNTDEVSHHEIRKKVEVILGDTCDAITMKTKSGTTTIFYSTKYEVDSTLYTGHRYGNWNFYVATTGALPLKMVIDTPQFTMESTATEIKKLPLSDDQFAVDPNAPVKRSA